MYRVAECVLEQSIVWRRRVRRAYLYHTRPELATFCPTTRWLKNTQEGRFRSLPYPLRASRIAALSASRPPGV